MNTKQRQATAMMALLCTMGLQAQVVNNGGPGDYRLTLNGNAPRSFTIGSAFFTGASAFNIRGDQMGGTSVTPEVFRTIAPTTGNTFWRMFQGGTTAGFERGQLFAVPGQNHFNINAPNGHFQLHTQSVQRMRLNGNLTGSIGSFTTINRDGFLLLSGQPNAFVDANSRAPFTRLHLIDSVGAAVPVNYAQEIGYRPWMRNGITFTGNSDQSYIGQKYGTGDNTDFVIQWSDNPNGSLSDRGKRYVGQEKCYSVFFACRS